MTDIYGIVGDPVAHSLSPTIHNGWFRDIEIDAVYQRFLVKNGEFLRGLKDLETHGVKGINVTLPHKHAALLAAMELSSTAQKIGAVNTLTRQKNGDWHGENTDAPGFLAAISAHFDEDLKNLNGYILGAGGSSRAVVHALNQSGARLTICNRTPSKAAALAGEYAGLGHRGIALEDGLKNLDAADFIINTTSSGHGGESFNLPKGQGRFFMDISYGKIARPQLDTAKNAGWVTLDGIAMLVHQAALSFEIWQGVSPNTDAAIARCHNALELTT